jgi:TonB-dependent SusC/RagA subfamily outer membrane receptor
MVLILGLSISSLAQTKEVLSQVKIKNAKTINTLIVDSPKFSKSFQIKPYKFNPISLAGPRIIVIDGKVSEQGFGEIEPKDIQSLSVVKGEKATSLYGYKTGSGVIIITTKRGANETKVEKELNKK